MFSVHEKNVNTLKKYVGVLQAIKVITSVFESTRWEVVCSLTFESGAIAPAAPKFLYAYIISEKRRKACIKIKGTNTEFSGTKLRVLWKNGLTCGSAHLKTAGAEGAKLTYLGPSRVLIKYC